MAMTPRRRWSAGLAMPRLAAALLLALAAGTAGRAQASSLTFDLPYGQRKCFSEEMGGSGTARGTVHVASGRGDMSLDLFVSNAAGAVQFHKSDVNSIKFTFDTGGAAHSVEEYKFCVVNQVHPQAAAVPGVTRRVTLDVEHFGAGHRSVMDKLAKQEHTDKIFSTFSSVSNDVDSLIEKLDDMRTREKSLSDLNENTASTIVIISLLASLFTILTGLLNFMSLKSFFKRKKLA